MNHEANGQDDSTSRPLGAWVRELKVEDPRRREDAAWALGEFKWLAVPYLVEALDDEDAEVRRVAAATLSEIGPEAAPAVDALAQRSGDPVPAVRAEAVAALGRIGPASAAAAERLEGALEDEDPVVALAAAESLGHIGPAGLPGLTGALNHPSTAVRAAGIAGLGELGPLAKDALHRLIGALGTEEAETRIESVRALGRIAPRDRVVGHALASVVLRDTVSAVRLAAAAVLRDSDPFLEPVVAALEAAGRDPDPDVARTASESLHRLSLHRPAIETPTAWTMVDCKALPRGGSASVRVGGIDIALFHVGERHYALEDSCSHAGAKLSEGLVDGSTVTCPRHWARFDLRTGRDLNPPASRPVRRFEVRVEGASLSVAIPAPGSPRSERKEEEA